MQNHVRVIDPLHSALRAAGKSHTDRHLRDSPDTTVDDAVRVASGHLEQAAAHLRAALTACLPGGITACACRDCARAAELADAALDPR